MAETMTALVERVRAFKAALNAGVRTDWTPEVEAAFYANADTEAARIIETDPPRLRNRADLVAAISYVAEDVDFIQAGHKDALARALEYLAKPTPRTAPDMSGDLSQLKTLAGLANDMASGLDQRGMDERARVEMGELIALLAAMHAYASRSYAESERG